MTDARISRVGVDVISTDSDSDVRVTRIKGEVAGDFLGVDVRISRVKSEIVTRKDTEFIYVSRIMAEVASRANPFVEITGFDATEDFDDTAQMDLTVSSPPLSLSIAATEDFEDEAEIHLFTNPKGDCGQYTDLITMEHKDKPNFHDMVCYSVQPFADQQLQLDDRFVLSYDVDNAVGVQLDVIGQWVGIKRTLEIPVENVFFSWGIEGLGWGQGVWRGPYDKETGLVYLPDDHYRLLLKARIVNNHWDGTKEGAYEILNTVFNDLGYNFFIEDHADLSITLGLIGPPDPVALTKALFLSGKFNVKPAGIRIRGYRFQTGKLFAWGLDSDLFGGWGMGSWAIEE